MILKVNIQDQDIIDNILNDHVEEGVRTLYRICFDEVVKDIEYSGGNSDDGADVFQEAILILVKKIQSDQYRPESSLKTFLKGIARNLWMSEQRARGRRIAREKEYMSGTTEAEEPKLWRSPKKEFSELLNSIGETCKELLIGYYFEDMDVKTLSKAFSFKSEQVLRNRKTICMKKLKSLVENRKYLIHSLITDSEYE
jgi:RNA polymerase sigma factor (sigma-70 family)